MDERRRGSPWLGLPTMIGLLAIVAFAKTSIGILWRGGGGVDPVPRDRSCGVDGTAASRPEGQSSRSVTGHGDGHVILDGVGGSDFDAVGEDGEGQQVPVGGLAVADEVGHPGEGAGLALAAPRGAVWRMRSSSVPVARRRPCVREGRRRRAWAPAPRAGRPPGRERCGRLLRAPSRRPRGGGCRAGGDGLGHHGGTGGGGTGAAVAARPCP